MSYSLSSARRLAAGAVGAGAVAGAMLFGATPAANAAPAQMPAVMGPAHVATAPAFIAPQPDWWGHHHGFGHHRGFGRHGFWGHHRRGFFRGHHHRGWFGGHSVVRRTSVVRRGWW
ncbi:MAG TPA: hypothetical protein VMB04_27020 [Mycobacterium sp.]|nr:hypothetical protein [Mycobacterium sp.]